jgi:hypothetical protein
MSQTGVGRELMREVPWVAGLLVVAAVDYFTGPLVAMAPFYFAVLVPLALRRSPGVAVSYAGLATGMFAVVDLLSNPGLVHTFYPYWRGFSTLVSFVLVTATIPQLVRERDHLVRSEAELVRQRGELQELNGKLVAALEELGVTREQAIEKLLRRHTEELEQFKRLLASALTSESADDGLVAVRPLSHGLRRGEGA